MTSNTTPPTVQVCRNCGGGAPVDIHFCPQCEKILTLGRHGDYFRFMGLPRKLNLDPDELERRFRALSRQFHPDYFYNASAAERRASLERSSYLNDAYRVLRDPAARVEYILSLEGFGSNAAGWEQVGDAPQTGTPGSNKVPPALLEEVFALNEELDDVRGLRAGGAPRDVVHTRLVAAQRPIEAKRATHERQLQELAVQWDALVDRPGAPDEAGRRRVLEALRERVLERNYINNLLAGIGKELDA